MLIQIQTIEKIQNDSLLYDIQTETENFYADGILVHNSLCPMYYCPQTNQWEISTRGMAYAEANHSFGLKTDWTFRQAILDAMGFSEEQFQTCMNEAVFHKSCTYVMEYTSPFNRIVTPYEKPEMVLLAVVSNITGCEADVYGLEQWCKGLKQFGMNVRMPKIYRASSGDELVKMAESLPDLQEGFVVRNNKTGERLKIKNSVYVTAHRLKNNGNLTLKTIVETIITNEDSEFLVYFPEYNSMFDEIREKIYYIDKTIKSAYNEIQHISNQKEFALEAIKYSFSSVLFSMRKNNTEEIRKFISVEKMCLLLQITS